MSYFSHEYASNSDLKKWRKMNDPTYQGEPENIEEIFDLGTLIHQILLEPYKVNRLNKDFELANTMAQTFMKDSLCRQVLMLPDFRREHEFYNENIHGIKGRCKMDGESKMMDLVLEYKGLAVTTQKAFLDAIDRFDYDQGAAWYLDVSKRKRCFIAAVSKKDPKRPPFKLLIDRDHDVYKRGEMKVGHCVQLWKDTFGSVVKVEGFQNVA